MFLEVWCYVLCVLLILSYLSAYILIKAGCNSSGFTLGILTLAAMACFSQIMYFHLSRLGFGGDEEKNVCVTYMEISVSFLHCLARWWQSFLQIGYVIVCIFQAACLYFPPGFDFLRCQKTLWGEEGMHKFLQTDIVLVSQANSMHLLLGNWNPRSNMQCFNKMCVNELYL